MDGHRPARDLYAFQSEPTPLGFLNLPVALWTFNVLVISKSCQRNDNIIDFFFRSHSPSQVASASNCRFVSPGTISTQLTTQTSFWPFFCSQARDLRHRNRRASISDLPPLDTGTQILPRKHSMRREGAIVRQEQVVPTLQQFTDQSTQMSRLQILLGGLPKLEIPLAMSLAMSLAMREFTAFLSCHLVRIISFCTVVFRQGVWVDSRYRCRICLLLDASSTPQLPQYLQKNIR